MGLDMYLRAEQYFGGWEHGTEEERRQFRSVLRAAKFKTKDVAEHSPSVTISVTVAYWRKANAIHQWFVENVQNGEDDCGDYDVDREQLQALRAACTEVLRIAEVADGQPVHSGTSYKPGGEVEQHFVEGRAALNGEEIAEILPTQGGFFFGSTDYDEWYLRDIEDTIKQIDRVLSLPEGWYFQYHSSW